jgi:hypothetical protein
MEKTVNNYIFKHYDNFWLSNLIFDTTETTFEIYTNEFNVALTEKILYELNNKLPDIRVQAEILLKTLSPIFWGNNDYLYFEFTGFVINPEFELSNCDFLMCFHNYGKTNFSDYANWLVGIKDFKIIGCYRQQL